MRSSANTILPSETSSQQTASTTTRLFLACSGPLLNKLHSARYPSGLLDRIEELNQMRVADDDDLLFGLSARFE
jgi:hypothetical protein